MWSSLALHIIIRLTNTQNGGNRSWGASWTKAGATGWLEWKLLPEWDCCTAAELKICTGCDLAGQRLVCWKFAGFNLPAWTGFRPWFCHNEATFSSWLWVNDFLRLLRYVCICRFRYNSVDLSKTWKLGLGVVDIDWPSISGWLCPFWPKSKFVNENYSFQVPPKCFPSS